MLRALHRNRVSEVKYSHSGQLPISLSEDYWSSVQNNNNNAYYLPLSSGVVNNNNKNNSYRVRAYDDERKYLFPLKSLIDAYYDCRKNKKTKNECVRFSYNREENLMNLWDEVTSGKYKPVKSKAFVVTYPTKREVFAADFRDRIIHHWIALRFEPLIEKVFIDDSYNCRKGKGTAYGVNRTVEIINDISEGYTRKAYIAKWDLRGYFMSINKDMLWDKVCRIIDEMHKEDDKMTLLYLLKSVIYNEPQNNCILTSPIEMWSDLPKNKSLFTSDSRKGLPIGNLTSQLLANFYMADVDKTMKSKYKGYCRYVDDCWIISESKSEIRKAVREFKSMITELGCTMHPNKYYQQSVYKGVKLIGVVVKPHRTYVANRTIGRALSKMEEFGSLRVNKMNIECLMQSANSYLGLVKHYSSYNIRGLILRRIAPKWWHHIVSVKHRSKILISDYEHR